MTEQDAPNYDAPGASDDDRTRARRRFLQQAAAGAAIVWSAPVVLSTPAAAAGTPAPVPPFLAVGGDGSGVNLASTDGGVSWTAGGSTVAVGHLHAVEFTPLGGGKWVAVGQDPGADQSVAFSSTDDGVSWSPITLPIGSTGRLLGLATDGAGNWVAVGQTVTTFPGAVLILHSSDNGVTWTNGTFLVPPSPAINQLHGVATDGAGRWVAVGQNNSVKGILTISTDNGATWSSPLVLDAVNDAQIIGVAGDGLGNWIIGGSLTGPTNNAIMWFATGSNISTVVDWTPITSIGTGFVYGITTDRAGTFVAVGQRDDPVGGAFSYTMNGSLTPGVFPGPLAYQLHEVATDRAGTWIAVGFDTGGGMRTYTSVDNGFNWSVTSAPGAGNLLGVSAKALE